MYGEVRTALERMGYTRRYQRSRNWPSAPMRRLGSILHGWTDNRIYTAGHVASDEWLAESNKHPLMAQVGIPYLKRQKRRSVEKRATDLHEALRNV